MRKEQIAKLFAEFEAISRAEQDVEFWLARDLQPLFGCKRWAFALRAGHGGSWSK